MLSDFVANCAGQQAGHKSDTDRDNGSDTSRRTSWKPPGIPNRMPGQQPSIIFNISSTKSEAEASTHRGFGRNLFSCIAHSIAPISLRQFEAKLENGYPFRWSPDSNLHMLPVRIARFGLAPCGWFGLAANDEFGGGWVIHRTALKLCLMHC
jgi:hypothetical protein